MSVATLYTQLDDHNWYAKGRNTVVPPPPPPPPTATTKWGYNHQESGATYNQTIAGRKAWWGGRNPCLRQYLTGRMPSKFDQSAAICDELSVCLSFKDGGDLAGLAAGNYNSVMLSYLNSIPQNWKFYWVFHHEPNTGSGMELDVTGYRNVYKQMRSVLNSASLRSGVEVYITCNFQAYGLTTVWSDAWVPDPAWIDILTWDGYGNPGTNTSASGSNKYGTATGKSYGTTYPLPADRYGPVFKITERVGFKDSWGVLEFNAPARDWDTNENGRKLWHQDVIDLFMNPPMTGSTPPKILLPWEMNTQPFASWDQSYGRVSGNALTVANVIAPYMENSP